MSDHRVRVESQTWGSVPPHPPHTMYRASCKCSWIGQWFHYRGNVESACPLSAAVPESSEPA